MGDEVPDGEPGRQLNALVVAANTAFILNDDPSVIDRARTAVTGIIDAATNPVR